MVSFPHILKGDYGMDKVYYKSFDENLCGFGGFQYEVGKEYHAGTDDDFRWLHYASKIGTAAYYNDCGMRICVVKPLGRKSRFSGTTGCYYTTDCLRIERELSREEILEQMKAEKCRFHTMQKLQPSAEFVRGCLPYLKAVDRRGITASDYLTLDEKLELLPPYYHNEARRWNRRY